MKIIIPMAGFGNRFVNAGYKEPKPLITIKNKKIIEHIVETYDGNNEFIFICNDIHIQNTKMGEILNSLNVNKKIKVIPNHKLGPIHTVKYVFDEINDNEEVIINYCDTSLVWNLNDFVSHVRNKNLDGCIVTHTGFHPHTLSTTKMAFIKESNGLVKEIKEKSSYTNEPMKEHASSGIYYYKKGKFIKKYFQKVIDNKINYNGEYYVTLSYNLLINDGLKVGFYDTDFVYIYGTPEEIENMQAWDTILKGHQVKNENDLIMCYNYWKLCKENENHK